MNQRPATYRARLGRLRRAAGWLLLFSALACDQMSPPPSSVRDRISTAEAKLVESATSRPRDVGAGGQKPVAFVNGQPILRRELVELLVRSHGLTALQQLILLRLAEQESSKAGLSVSREDVDAEYDLTLEADRFNGRDKNGLTAARREQLVRDWCKSRGVSPDELALAMGRQAHLRKLAEREVTISEADLREEYERSHGRRAEVRHIQIAAPRFYPPLKERLEKREDFAKLVTEFSQNVVSREKGGLLPPFSAKDSTVPAIFAKVAFELKPGETSDLLKAEGSYHVLKLERFIEPEGRPFEEVRDRLRQTLGARRVAQTMERLGALLLQRAVLRIDDLELRAQYRADRAEGRIPGPALQP